MASLSTFCRAMLYGNSDQALTLRYAMIGMDLLIIIYFIVTTFLTPTPWMTIVDIGIGIVLLVELMGRLISDSDRVRFLSRPLTVTDIAIILSLLLPIAVENLTFLRIIRAARLFRSYRVSHELRKHVPLFRRHDDIVFSIVNLIVYIFVVTALVFVLQQASNPSINNYIDALYFTITTLTTTGFGDITLVGSTGRLLAVLIMVVGVALFLRLVQTIFRPNKVRYECRQCGLGRHELDAVHCKHCGELLHIRTEGTDY